MSFLKMFLALTFVTLTGFTLAQNADDARRAAQDMIDGSPR